MSVLSLNRLFARATVTAAGVTTIVAAPGAGLRIALQRSYFSIDPLSTSAPNTAQAQLEHAGFVIVINRFRLAAAPAVAYAFPWPTQEYDLDYKLPVNVALDVNNITAFTAGLGINVTVTYSIVPG